jgi:integrase
MTHGSRAHDGYILNFLHVRLFPGADFRGQKSTGILILCFTGRHRAPQYPFLGGKNAATFKQIQAALSFAYVKNPFAKIDPPLYKEPKIRYLLLADVRRLLDYLKARRQDYGSALVFHLANALFQTACRFDELIQLT